MHAPALRCCVRARLAVFVVVENRAAQPIIPLAILRQRTTVDVRDFGAATSTVQFFRALAGAVTPAVFGSTLNSLTAQRIHDGATVSVAYGHDGKVPLSRSPGRGRAENELTPTQAQAASILRDLHAVITAGCRWDRRTATHGTRTTTPSAIACSEGVCSVSRRWRSASTR